MMCYNGACNGHDKWHATGEWGGYFTTIVSPWCTGKQNNAQRGCPECIRWADLPLKTRIVERLYKIFVYQPVPKK